LTHDGIHDVFDVVLGVCGRKPGPSRVIKQLGEVKKRIKEKKREQIENNRQYLC
jgi:hypothetical protein